MFLQMDIVWIVAIYLLTLRIGVLLVMTPIFSNLANLASVRVLFTLMLSVVLVSGLGIRPEAVPLTAGTLLLASFGELAIGAVMAFGVLGAFGAFSVAGKILDVQTGFGMGSVFDPVTRAGSPLFATMLNLAAVAVFFGMEGHHALWRGLAFSAQQIPPGAGLSTLNIDALISQFGLMFSLGVALIAPVMLGLLLVEVALAAMSRVLPQMNIFVVGVPAKIFAGLAIFALTIGVLGDAMGRAYASIFRFWEQVL